MINCFHKCGFRKERPDIQLLDQEREEQEFASILKELTPYVSPSDYINFDMEAATLQSPIDVESIAWKQEPRQDVIKLIMGSKNSQDNENPMEFVSVDEPEEVADLMAIKSVSEALQIVDRVMCFSQQRGNEEFYQSLMTVIEKLQDIQINNRREIQITDYFHK